MKLQLQSGGVWVKASEELPEDKRHDNGTPMQIVLRNKYAEDYINYRTMTPNQIKDFFKGPMHTDGWEWLKPVEQVYLFTPADLEEMLITIFENLKSGDITKALQSIT